MKHSGHVQSSQILEFTVEPAIPRVRGYLQLPDHSDVYKVIRIRLVDDIPMMFEEVYLPESDFPGLENKDIAHTSLFDMITRDYQILLGKIHQTLEPVLINALESQLLKVNKGNPALLIERITRKLNGSPIIYNKMIIRGDRCRFVTEVSGNNS